MCCAPQENEMGRHVIGTEATHSKDMHRAGLWSLETLHKSLPNEKTPQGWGEADVCTDTRLLRAGRLQIE